MTPGETVNQIAVEVFGNVLHQIQAVGIWGNSLYGYNLRTQVQTTRVILDGNPHRFEMDKIWQPYALQPLNLFLDYLTILASFFLLQFTFLQARTQLRKKSRLCTKCAYPILKSDSDTTCPECGQLNPAQPNTPQPQ